MNATRGPKLLTLLCAAALGFDAVGCQDCETTAKPEIAFDEGITTPDGRFYESTPIDAEWLHFPAGRQYKLRHDLVGVPVIQTYVAFPHSSDDPNNPPGRPTSYTESAGNQVIINVTGMDEHHFEIRNDTCAELYVRVVATADGVESGPQSMGGAGGSSSAASR